MLQPFTAFAGARRIVFALIVALAAAATHAADIVLGQVAPLRVAGSVGNQVRGGIELYLDVVNAAGGIGGARLRLATKDRADASDSAQRTRELLRESKPVALIGLQGTGPMEALLEAGVVAEAAVPIVGMRTGATSLHAAGQPWLFHTRASYEAEMRKIVEHLLTIGLRRIALFVEEDTAFGREGLRHAEAALAAAKLVPLVVAGYAKGSVAVAAAVDAVVRAQPHAVIAVGETPAVAEFYKALRATGSRALVVTLSTVDAAAVVKRLGAEQAHGLAIAQVVPDPANPKSPIAREFQTHARRLRPPSFELTHAGLEGYIAAKVLVEALRRNGPAATPAQLRAALENLGRFDVGGLHVEFTPMRHSGATYVDIGIIGRRGQLLQ